MTLANILLVLSFATLIPIDGAIVTIMTAALIEKHYDYRQVEYEHSLNVLRSYGIIPIIFEACTNKKTFLENYSPWVIHPMVNDSSLKNKGVNEAKLIQKALSLLPLDDHDIIIKITGRYYFTKPDFLHLVQTNQHEFDAFVKKDRIGQVFTGCFAIRVIYLKEWLSSINYEIMEKNMINIEMLLAQYLDKNQHRIRVLEIENLHMIANIFGSGDEIIQTLW